MNELAHILERLELSQYYENFVEEGFDSWETVLYITESDLDALNVKLGHRRKLQREIAHARGINFEQLLAQSNPTGPLTSATTSERGQSSYLSQSESTSTVPSGPTKRKYRRHPKPDESGPERPPSAYVIFSNQIREELKPYKLSFTEIAKTVGERWQNLSPEEKEPYESKATALKDTYNQEMVVYRKTPQYREYMLYLADFKAKNPGTAGDSKRTRLDKELSRTSSGSKALKVTDSGTDSDRRLSGAPSPVEGAFEPYSGNVVRPSLPTGLSASSTSSASPTSSMPPGGPPPPLSPQGTQSRPQQLPRIHPLEPRDPIPLQPSPKPDPYLLSRGNARRTTGTVTAPFIRHDTSKSSVSSNISGGSTGSSSVFTPITPIDEGPPRAFNRTAPSGVNLDRPPPMESSHGYSLPPLSQTSSSQSGGSYQGGPASGYTFQNPVPMKRLSLQDDDPGERAIQRPRSNPPDTSLEPSMSPRSPLHQRASMSSDQIVRSPDREDHEKMDPLSVLALAGSVMDRRPDSSDRPP